MTDDEMKHWLNGQVQIIKTKMPETYKDIQAKAAKIGNEAYALVKRGLRGEPNCFWATECGLQRGTPFTQVYGADWIADQIRQFGCLHVCMFPLLKETNPKD